MDAMTKILIIKMHKWWIHMSKMKVASPPLEVVRRTNEFATIQSHYLRSKMTNPKRNHAWNKDVLDLKLKLIIKKKHHLISVMVIIKNRLRMFQRLLRSDCIKKLKRKRNCRNLRLKNLLKNNKIYVIVRLWSKLIKRLEIMYWHKLSRMLDLDLNEDHL